MKWKIEGVATPKLDEFLFTVGARLPSGLGKLGRVSFDSHDASSRTSGPSHGTGQLADTTPHVEDAFTAFQGQFTECGLVEQLVEPRQPLLFLRRAPWI